MRSAIKKLFNLRSSSVNDSDNYYVLQPDDERLAEMKEYVVLEEGKPVLYNGATAPQLAQFFRDLITALYHN